MLQAKFIFAGHIEIAETDGSTVTCADHIWEYGQAADPLQLAAEAAIDAACGSPRLLARLDHLVLASTPPATAASDAIRVATIADLAGRLGLVTVAQALRKGGTYDAAAKMLIDRLGQGAASAMVDAEIRAAAMAVYVAAGGDGEQAGIQGWDKAEIVGAAADLRCRDQAEIACPHCEGGIIITPDLLRGDA